MNTTENHYVATLYLTALIFSLTVHEFKERAVATDYEYTMTKFLIQLPLPNKFWGFVYKGLVVCTRNRSLMENMDKEPTITK